MKRCMFVDDSSVIRKVAKRILGGSDLVVIEAASGRDALEMCDADMPEIIVVDGALPDLPAVDLIRRIRAMESLVRPQILISLVELDVARIPTTLELDWFFFTVAPKLSSRMPKKPDNVRLPDTVVGAGSRAVDRSFSPTPMPTYER